MGKQQEMLTEFLDLTRQMAEFYTKYGKETDRLLGLLCSAANENPTASQPGKGVSDLIRLKNCLLTETHKEKFPVGTIINDCTLDDAGKWRDDPFIVVDYVSVLLCDGSQRTAAVLLRKHTMFTVDFRGAHEWLNSETSWFPEKVSLGDPKYGYLHYCSEDLKHALEYSMRAYTNICTDEESSVVCEPCRFFLPSPKNLGFNVSEEEDLDAAMGDFRPWTYFTCDRDTAPKNLMPRRIGMSLTMAPTPYFLRSRIMLNDTKNPDYEIDVYGNAEKLASFYEKVTEQPVLRAVRPACYIW